MKTKIVTSIMLTSKWKNLLLTFYFLLFTFHLFSQAPQGFNYQAVARDGDNAVLVNTTLDVKIGLHQGSETGTLVWEETHSVTTNDLGLFTLTIGDTTATYSGGTALTFADIDWTTGSYYMKVEVNDGGDYVDMGSAELLSVPYALSASSVSDLKKLNILGPSDQPADSALFEVKNKDGQTVFAVYNEGVRVYVDTAGTKGLKGGFAVGGFKSSKGKNQEFLRVSADSVRIYIDTLPTKGLKGGFAVGGYSPGKGLSDSYFNISGKSEAEIIDPSDSRILWYPKKEAFLTGRVLIESPDSVGTNSIATGYESKAVGNWSQALGYQTIARGDYSTSIGKNSVTQGINTFAFGNQAQAIGDDSYALGTGALALGEKSFAFGSVGLDSAGVATGQTRATGEYAFALGFGSQAIEQGAFAIGFSDTASGPYSVAMGYQTKASEYFSTALGNKTIANSWASTAMGSSTTASGEASTAMGNNSTASGSCSIAVGWNALASGSSSTALGAQTTASGGNSIAMGSGTTASSYASTATGSHTTASGPGATAMGFETKASGDFSTAVGFQTTASGWASIAIGRQTIACGGSSTAMGEMTTASGNNSTAMGSNASTNNKTGSFVYGDVSTSDSVYAILDNQFVVRASGGTVFYSSSDLSTGVSLAAGGGSWSSVSDRNKKENYKDIEKEELLEKLSNINIQSWNYKSQSTDIKHIGIVAQDFYHNFGYGESDTTITSIDLAGVNMVAVQGLIGRTEKLNEQNRELLFQVNNQQKMIKDQQSMIETQQSEIDQLKEMVNKLLEVVNPEP